MKMSLLKEKDLSVSLWFLFFIFIFFVEFLLQICRFASGYKAKVSEFCKSLYVFKDGTVIKLLRN